MTTTSLQNWITLSAIQIGGAICLPMILIGFELSKTNSLMGCLFSIAIANSALFVLGLLSSKMSVSFRKTTGELAISYFGPFGRFLFAGVLFISMCGWFSIQTEIMTEDIHHFIQNLNPFYGLIGLSLLIYGINIIGISAIARFSSATVPLMLVTLVTVIACNFSCTIDLFEGEKSLIPTTAISLLLSSCIACIFDFPTFFRHAKDEKEAYKATSMIFFVGIPLVELLGVLIGKTSDSKSLIEALLIFQHPLWNTWICAFILLCGLSTNTANLYSAAMSLQCIFKGLSEKKATLMSVAFCIGLSFFKITNHLVIYLEVIGILVASQSACMLVLFIQKRENSKQSHAICSFLIGTIFGLIGIFYPTKTLLLPIVDAMILSSGALVFLQGINYKKAVVIE